MPHSTRFSLSGCFAFVFTRPPSTVSMHTSLVLIKMFLFSTGTSPRELETRNQRLETGYLRRSCHASRYLANMPRDCGFRGYR